MTRSLMVIGLVVATGCLFPYLLTEWDVLALTGIGLGLSMCVAHYAITRSFRGPTVPRQEGGE